MSPGVWPHHAAPAWRQVFDRRLRPLNLTPTSHAAGIRRLANPAGVADHGGADRMMTSKGATGLVQRSLVDPAARPGDGRVKRLLLTPEGRELIRLPRGFPARDLQHIAAKARAAA
jgi:hypothetical protein